MRPFSTGELGRLAGTQEGAMQDTCLVLSYSEGSRAPSGAVVATYTPGAAISCGLNPKGGREVTLEDKTNVVTDASVRLPLGTVIKPSDRVQITHRFGVALGSPLTFRVAGPIRQGPSGLLVDLRIVEV